MILVLNCGSQSIKWKLFKDDLKLREGAEKSVFNSGDYQRILRKELKKISSYEKEIKIVGHRVVHGGNNFRKPALISKKVLEEIKRFNKFAPLHNPFNILGIKTAQKIFPTSKQMAVFDTGFYRDLPDESSIYPLPEYIRKRFGFQRLGFHGISHEFAAKQAAKEVGQSFKKLKIITCHLGGGSSITAIKNGRAIDTSMGFTPLEGVTMMTRPGDIDAGVVLEIAKKYSTKKTSQILNCESGVKGICGESKMLKVLEKIKKGDRKAKSALNIFTYTIKKYIGAYFAILGGCDLLVFTGTIGWGSRKIRNMICQDLPILKNTKILKIKTNEELAIANEVKKWISK